MKKYIQITAGRGPVECARAVALVARKICRSIPDLAVTYTEPHKSERDCYMSITLASQSEIPASIVSEWEGTVLWQSTANPYRPGHRRKIWFVGVHFIDELELTEIDEKDIAYSSCRSSGKGGQNINKVETAVRATHIPTGTSVRCSDERSQFQNRNKARERLLLKLLAMQDDAKNVQNKENWNRHDSLVRGNPVKKFSGSL